MSTTGSPEAATNASNEEDNAKTDLPNAVEFEPPLACVRRILKTSLPSSTNVGKDASSAFARACGIFIIYLTACANDYARENKRQTITANDILAAIKELDFDEFTPDLVKFLDNYRAAEKNKKNAKAKAAAEKAEQKGKDDENDDDSHDDEAEDDEEEDGNKRGHDELADVDEDIDENESGSTLKRQKTEETEEEGDVVAETD
jgi:DNA polymerase epsilon subunit 3